MRADGHQVSTSTVERALRRRGLLLPRGFRADRKSWAAIRRRVFHDPPTERNRVWQTDFSEFETPRGGIWRICAVIDYATKYCLAATVTPTARSRDALICLRRQSPRRNGSLAWTICAPTAAPSTWSTRPPAKCCAPCPPRSLSCRDNGSCFRGEIYQAAFAGDDPLLRHVRTRVRSPQTNGVIERLFGTLKYEHLFRAPIDDGDALAMEASCSARSTTPSDLTSPSATAPRPRHSWLAASSRRARAVRRGIAAGWDRSGRRSRRRSAR